MGSLKSTCSTRCRYAACFLLGFVVASLLLAVMFWIIWCYMGLTIVQISDAQRRGVASYSYTTPKPPSTSSPPNRTEVDGALESSLNAISKSPVTPPTQPRRRSDSTADLAKGDFAARTQGGASQNSTRRESTTTSVASSSHERKAPILHKGEDDGLHTRKVSTSNTENRDPEDSHPEIKPTQTYAPAQSDPLPIEPKEERRSPSRDLDRKDEVQSSRPSYRDPEFEKDLPPRRSDPGRRRNDDEDDYFDRGSPSRYDKRDRGRDTDDRYSKGDTRVYPDERPRLDDRYPPRDSDRRRGDGRDREDPYRDREDRYRDKDDSYREDRYRDKDDSYREDRHRDREDRYRDREDRYRDYDDKYRGRDGYLDDGRDRRRDERYEDRYPARDDRYGPRYPDDDDKLRSHRYDDRRDKTRDGEDRYPSSRDRDYRDPIMSSRDDISLDRKSGRPDDSRRPSDYDVPIRDRTRTSYNDESRTIDRYPSRNDEYPRPSRHDDRDTISPTRARDEAYTSRSTVPLSRFRDDAYESGSSIDGRKRDDDRYSSNRDRSRYYGDDSRRLDESRYISPSSVREIDGTRRSVIRDDYPTRSLDERKLDDESPERISYSADEEEEYRRQNSRTRYYDDIDRKPSEGSRRGYQTDDDYPSRRTDDNEYRRSGPRGGYDTSRPRDPDRYRPRDDDDRPSRRYDESRRRSDGDIGLRKESYPRDVIDERRTAPRRPDERLPERDRRYEDDLPPRRTKYDDSVDDPPLRPTIDRTSEERRRYKEDVPTRPDDSPRGDPLRSERREPFVGSSTSPRDVVREKRFHSSGRPFEDSGNNERPPINAKDVIETALKEPDAPNHNPRDVPYPVYNPNNYNSTSSDNIPLSDRRGSIIPSGRRRRSRAY